MMMDKRRSLQIFLVIWSGTILCYLYYYTCCNVSVTINGKIHINRQELSEDTLDCNLVTQIQSSESHQQINKTLLQQSQVSYALSLHYMDQITCGARRVRSLQCWAKQLTRSLRVVQPSINSSYFGPPLKSPMDGLRRFSDVFDIDWWNHHGAVQAEYLPMATWEELFFKAPRETILVSFLYRDDPRCFENPPPNSACKLDEVQRFWLDTLKQFSFTVVREVCINFRDSDVFDKDEFEQLIFGGISASTPVTIVFNDWRGPLGKASKHNKNEFNALLRYRDGQCTPVTQDGFVRNLTRISLQPVPEILHSAEIYATKYLNTSTDYVAVMVRWELILLEHVYWAHAFKDRNHGKQCKDKILEYLKEIRVKEGINSTFLATDAGRFGSRVLQPNVSFHGVIHEKPARELTEDLLGALNDKPRTLEEYDQHFADFDEATGHSIYSIPQFQKAIAARAKCLLLVGWGTFHENALALYMRQHQGNICYKNIRRC